MHLIGKRFPREGVWMTDAMARCCRLAVEGGMTGMRCKGIHERQSLGGAVFTANRRTIVGASEVHRVTSAARPRTKEAADDVIC